MSADQFTPNSLLNVRWMEPLIKTLCAALEKMNAPETVKRALIESGDLEHVAWWISSQSPRTVEGVEKTPCVLDDETAAKWRALVKPVFFEMLVIGVQSVTIERTADKKCRLDIWMESDEKGGAV